MLRVHCGVSENTVDEPPRAGVFSRYFHRVSVAIAKGKHPVPFRTRKLSLSAPIGLQAGACGRLGRCRTNKTPLEDFGLQGEFFCALFVLSFVLSGGGHPFPGSPSHSRDSPYVVVISRQSYSRSDPAGARCLRPELKPVPEQRWAGRMPRWSCWSWRGSSCGWLRCPPGGGTRSASPRGTRLTAAGMSSASCHRCCRLLDHCAILAAAADLCRSTASARRMLGWRR